MAEFEAFAAFQFELAAPEEDGVPLIDHLLAAERMSGVTPDFLLNAPAMPEGCEELWSIFGELHSCRGSSMNGPTRITYGDIDAYQRVSGTLLAPWERKAIHAADRAYLDDFAARQPKRD